MRDYYEDNADDDEGITLPAYVYGCMIHPFELSADRILDNAIESMELEDDDPSIPNAVDELEAFIKEWNAKQSFTSWMQNTKEVVVLDA